MLLHSAGQFIRERIHNNHRLQTSRFTKNDQLFHREHGCVRFAFPADFTSCSDDSIGRRAIALAHQWNVRIDFLQVVLFRKLSVSSCFSSKLGVDSN